MKIHAPRHLAPAGKWETLLDRPSSTAGHTVYDHRQTDAGSCVTCGERCVLDSMPLWADDYSVELILNTTIR